MSDKVPSPEWGETMKDPLNADIKRGDSKWTKAFRMARPPIDWMPKQIKVSEESEHNFFGYKWCDTKQVHEVIDWGHIEKFIRTLLSSALSSQIREIRIERKWAMPSMHTFTIRPIAELLSRYVGDGVGWLDPFAGENSPAEYTNDHNPEKPTKYHLEAIDFVKELSTQKFNGALFDPPYSYRQVSEHYKVLGKKATQLDTSTNFYNRVLNPLANVIKDGGYCISFGWNSNGMGKNRGFEIVEILLVAHGGHHNDTIVTVERKNLSLLDSFTKSNE